MPQDNYKQVGLRPAAAPRKERRSWLPGVN